MSRRMFLHQKFYGEPTKENLDTLVSHMEYSVIEHIITKRESDYIVKKAQEYYDEMQILQQDIDNV